jgi:cyclopropane fatty-acyl-phospholipid synthase-like methyltransferase
VLDLGCGDASNFAPALARLAPSRYLGVDLSETALGLAAENLKSLSCPVELRREDLLAAVGEGDESFDVIHTSFALHHLATEMKAEFFRRAARRLAPGGMLLLVDVMREEDESLPVYFERYTRWLRDDWRLLTEEEREATCAHLTANDLPETVATLQAQGRAAGLEPAPVVAFTWHKVARFTRPRAA